MFCTQAFGACPDGYTVASTSTTDTELGTLLSSSNVCVSGSGTIDFNETITIPASTELYIDTNAILNALSGGQIVLGGNNASLDGDGTVTNTGGVSYPIECRGANITCALGPLRLYDMFVRVLQNNSPPSMNVTGTYFNNAQLYFETADNSTITGATWTNCATKRPFQCAYCQNVTVEDGFIDSGIAGVIFLANHSISAARKANTGNIVQDMTISGVSEEGINFDVNGDEETQNAVREYDTVSSTSGTNQIVLADAGWTGDTTYNSGNYYLGFISGALIGEYYKISSQSGATFTLTGMTAELIATIQAGDQVWIGLPAFNNTIKRNTISDGGIVLWGLAFDNTVGGSTADKNTLINAGISCYNLDGLASGTVTGNSGRAPCDNNVLTYNKIINGTLCANCSTDYGGIAGMYSTNGNSITGTYFSADVPDGYAIRPNKRMRRN